MVYVDQDSMKTALRQPGIRFIGSKEPLLPFIQQVLTTHLGDGQFYVADLFCGTASVSRLFKKLGYRVLASDNLFFPYALACSILEISREPSFARLVSSGEISGKTTRLFATNYDKVLDRLNNEPGIEGFIYREYSPGGSSSGPYKRLYFSDENAKKIDGIRARIKKWADDALIARPEQFLFLADLLRATNAVANIAGTYGCFMKHWDRRALRPLTLTRSHIVSSTRKHRALWGDANQIAASHRFDVIYLDPPYTWRHYGAYYHILETIARGDEPLVTGITGLRPWEDTKSAFCDRSNAAEALERLVSSAKCDHLLLSYNSEGLITHQQIMDILSSKGRVTCHETMHRRYLSNNGGSKHSKVKERLYYVQIR